MCFLIQSCRGEKKNQFSSIFRLQEFSVCVQKGVYWKTAQDISFFNLRRLMPGVKKDIIDSGNEFFSEISCKYLPSNRSISVAWWKKSNRKTSTRGKMLQQSTEDFLVGEIFFFLFVHRWLKYQRAWLENGKILAKTSRMENFPKITQSWWGKASNAKIDFFFNCLRIKHEKFWRK